MSDDETSGTIVRAAGGVVWRVRSGMLQVALVHRPRYDDWSLPKGKLTPRESTLAAAVREIGEELGSTVTVSRRLPSVAYRLPGSGARKRVDYWTMQHLGGTFSASDEVDQVAWLALPEARSRCTHDSDRTVLDGMASLPVPDSVVVLVRHARAGKRSEWSGPDARRPLDRTGRRQARRLTGFLRCFGPDRVLAADPLRCVQTVEPFAEHAGLAVVVESAFGDEAYARAPRASETALLALAKPRHVTVVCSQGATIPGLVPRLLPDIGAAETKKAAAWVLSFVDGTAMAADYYPHAGR